MEVEQIYLHTPAPLLQCIHFRKCVSRGCRRHQKLRELTAAGSAERDDEHRAVLPQISRRDGLAALALEQLRALERSHREARLSKELCGRVLGSGC